MDSSGIKREFEFQVDEENFEKEWLRHKKEKSSKAYPFACWAFLQWRKRNPDFSSLWDEWPDMKIKEFAAVFAFLSISCFGFDQSNLYLKTGIDGGTAPRRSAYPQGLAAYLLNLESQHQLWLLHQYRPTGAWFQGADRRKRRGFPEHSEGIESFRKRLNLKVSQGAWAEIQHERKFGRRRLSTFAAIGLALYLEDAELNESVMGYRC